MFKKSFCTITMVLDGFGSSSSHHELHSGQTVNPGRLLVIKSPNFGGSKYSPFVESYHSVHDEMCQVSQVPEFDDGKFDRTCLHFVYFQTLLYGFQLFPVEFPCNPSIAVLGIHGFPARF